MRDLRTIRTARSRLQWLSLALAACALLVIATFVTWGRVAGEADAAAPVAEVAAARSPSSSRVIETSLRSTALGFDIPYLVYLPPGYDSSTGQRFPVLYMLHGLGADRYQWQQHGLFSTADALIQAGVIQPLIIVTPEGKSSYWVNHANGGPRWGAYVTQDLVGEIDRNYRTVSNRESRAIGGASMGAHGALQLAINSHMFGVVGGHSIALRRFEETFPFFGDRTYFEANDPVSLCRKNASRALDIVIWLDIGQDDARWRPAAQAFHEQLQAAGVLHTWQLNAGGHDAAYWAANLQDYLQFYSRALALPETSPGLAARAP